MYLVKCLPRPFLFIFYPFNWPEGYYEDVEKVKSIKGVNLKYNNCTEPFLSLKLAIKKVFGNSFFQPHGLRPLYRLCQCPDAMAVQLAPLYTKNETSQKFARLTPSSGLTRADGCFGDRDMSCWVP